jgi:CHASE2 domain-containing sensor protein
VATKRQITRSEVGPSAAVDYAGRPGTIPVTSYWRVLQGRFKPGTFRGKIVVVGAVAASLLDVHQTPVGGLMSGPELQANSVETALRGFPLNPRKVLDIALIVVLGFVVAVANLRFNWKANLAVALAAGVGYVVAVQLAFNNDALLPVVYPLIALVITTAFMLGWSFRTRRQS